MSFPPGRDSHPNHQKDQKQVGEAILGFPMWEGYGAIGASPVKHCEDGEGIETRLIQGDTGRASTVQTREEEMSKYLIEKKERARLFSVVSSGRTRDNHDKWKHKKFYPNTGKYVFYSEGGGGEKQILHREIAESPTIRIFKTWLWSWATGSSLHEQGLD